MPTYDVRYKFGDDVPSYVHGETRSKAKYNKYLDVADCFESFKEFVAAIKSVRKVAAPDNAYDFIERQYGSRFFVGQRVVVKDGDNSETESGTVVFPSGGNGSYVSVMLDDRGHVGLFHPMSLRTFPSPRADTEGERR